MQDKQPLTQGLEQKLREAGFAPPEPLQKREKPRHKIDAGKTQPSKEMEIPMDENNQQQQQQQEQPQQSIPPVPLDPREARVLDNFDRVTAALANRLEGKAEPSRFQAGEVATLAAKTGVVVVGVAAGTAAVLGIKALFGSSTDPTPTP